MLIGFWFGLIWQLITLRKVWFIFIKHRIRVASISEFGQSFDKTSAIVAQLVLNMTPHVLNCRLTEYSMNRWELGPITVHQGHFVNQRINQLLINFEISWFLIWFNQILNQLFFDLIQLLLLQILSKSFVDWLLHLFFICSFLMIDLIWLSLFNGFWFWLSFHFFNQSIKNKC